jgi:hypothetical protein
MRINWPIALLCVSALASSAAAQTSAPSVPAPNVQSKPGSTIVVNPTHEECTRGWTPGLKWSKEQFDDFCQKLGTSK